MASIAQSSTSGPLAQKLRIARRLIRKAGSHPVLSFLIPFLVVLICRTALLVEVPPPQPLIEDEFSYLLAGDTFASFRLTNPQHPLWEHFETIHELMRPTYMSKYPPMQGLFLALGRLFFGVPWVGVLLSMAIFCGILPWTFRAWIPPDWALFGALLATFKIGIISYWTESFWGGTPAAIGGALVLGAVGRLRFQPTPLMVGTFTLGAGVLANSRPFEGAVWVFTCACYLLWKWFGHGRWRRTWPAYLLRSAPTACLVALPILLAMGYDNYRVTGKVTEFPYQAFEKQYAIWPPWVWQRTPSPEPVYHHQFIRRVWIDWDSSEKVHEHRYPVLTHVLWIIGCFAFYFGPAFITGGFLLVGALFFGSKNREILFLLVFYALWTNLITSILPHYTAPAAALIYLAVAAAMRSAWYVKYRSFPVGRYGIIWLLVMFLSFTGSTLTDADNRYLFYKPKFIEKRRQVLSLLDREPGLQLVFVRYGSSNDINEVWTFNSPDIDASRIVWVDAMTPAEDEKVLDYYKPQGRKVWLLEANADLTLRPYATPDAVPVISIKDVPFVSPWRDN